MPYSITRYDGSPIGNGVVVADGTIDQSTSLKIIGKNYAGYGEIQNENFIYLLENFAGTTQPNKPLSGQIWFDSGTKKLKFFDGDSLTGKWRTTGGAEVSDVDHPPTGLTTGDFWFNTTTKQLFAWDQTLADFVLVGPQAAGQNQTEMYSRTVVDDGAPPSTHAIIEAKVNGATAFVISTDAFTLGAGAGNTITGFSKIKKGITHAYTTEELITVNSVSRTYVKNNTNNDTKFWGTASTADALLVQGSIIPSDNFVRKDQIGTFNELITFKDVGWQMGDVPQLKVSILAGTRPIVENFVGSTIEFRTQNSGTKYPLTISGQDVLPGGTGSGATSNNVNNLGSSSAKWATVYATSFNGIATKATTLFDGADYRLGDVTSAINTVAVRDGTGDLYANHFRGIASQSFYADLAEKYLADADYEIGTVVSVGGEKEVTASKYGDRALGAVSGKPAYMMNSELEGGTYIALKGRVPVKVVGAVRKGQRLVAANDGTAVAAVPHANDVFAIALESSDDTSVKLVEAVIL
jgi:hypothetical protein